MSQCRSCGVEVRWALTPSGAKAPIEAQASADGTVLVMRPRGFDEYLAVVLSKDALTRARDRQLPLHKNHFATCAEAEQWKKD